jgi:hypothetical protein
MPNAEGRLSGPVPTERHHWTGEGDVVERALLEDGREIRIQSPADEATLYSIEEVERAILSMPAAARRQLETINIEPEGMNGNVGGASTEVPTIALFNAGEKMTHDQLVLELVHESGHVMSYDRWGSVTTGPNWDRWQDAMQDDRIRASGYAAENISEDFAETFAIYHSVIGTEWEAPVRAKLSHRFEILDDFIAREGDRSPIAPRRSPIYFS